MKRLIFNKVFFVLFGLMGIVSVVRAQDTMKIDKPSKASTIEKQIENKDFVFVATMAIPLNETPKQLTDYYNLKLKNDSLIVDLPYFGHAYVAPMDPTKISVSFTSTKFDYTVSKNKKGGWDIYIKIKDQEDTQAISIDAYDNGNAYVSITNNNRQPISYKGYLEEKK